MYYLPGCYNFNDEIGIVNLWIREKIEQVIFMLYKFERLFSF